MSAKKSEETIVDVAQAYTKTEDFVNRNGKTITTVFGIILLLALGYFLYKNFVLKPKYEQAASVLYMAEDDFMRDSLNKALNSNTLTNPGLIGFIQEYESTPSGNLAKHYAGASYLNLGEYQLAKQYLMDCSFDDLIQESARLGAIGDACVELNQYDEAAGYFRQAANHSSNELTTPIYLKKLGIVLEELGKNTEANEAYQQIKDDFPTTQIGRDIEKYIARTRSKSS